jgi:predicted ATP-grasp superfamily ATP-dependent carboligase
MQVSLPNRCVINIPYLAYADALGKKLEANNTHEDNSKWVFLLQDITLSLKKLKKGELSMGNWIRSYRGKKEYAIFAWDDPLPAFQGFFHLGKQL